MSRSPTSFTYMEACKKRIYRECLSAWKELPTAQTLTFMYMSHFE